MYTTPRTVTLTLGIIATIVTAAGFITACRLDSRAWMCVGLIALAVATASFIKYELERLIARLDGEREMTAYELGRRARGV